MRAAAFSILLLLALGGLASAGSTTDIRTYYGSAAVASTPPSGGCGLHRTAPVGSVCFVTFERTVAERFEILDATGLPAGGVVQHWAAHGEAVGPATPFCGASPAIPLPEGARMVIVEIGTVDLDACMAGVATTGRVVRESLR